METVTIQLPDGAKSHIETACTTGAWAADYAAWQAGDGKDVATDKQASTWAFLKCMKAVEDMLVAKKQGEDTRSLEQAKRDELASRKASYTALLAEIRQAVRLA